MTTRKKTALILMTAPTALFILTFILFAVTNLVFNSTFWPTPDGEGPVATPIFITITNVILFILGAISTLTWLPGLITGIVLLATSSASDQAKS